MKNAVNNVSNKQKNQFLQKKSAHFLRFTFTISKTNPSFPIANDTRQTCFVNRHNNTESHRFCSERFCQQSDHVILRPRFFRFYHSFVFMLRV